MTKEEIKKILDNTKVYVNGKSKEIQEKLFSFGYSWWNGSKIVDHTDKPFLFIDNDITITYGDDMEYFIKHKKKEITAEEILSIELTKPSYRPFKTKEECWNEMLKHHPFGWTKLIGETGYSLITDVDDEILYSDAFKGCTFADGTPFGIKEE